MRWEDVTVGDFIIIKGTSVVSRIMSIHPSQQEFTLRKVEPPHTEFAINKSYFDAMNFELVKINFDLRTGEKFFETDDGNSYLAPSWLMERDMPRELLIGPGVRRMGDIHPSGSLSIDGRMIANIRGVSFPDEEFTHTLTVNRKRECTHKWRGTLLFFKTVYDCEVCGAKKEDIA